MRLLANEQRDVVGGMETYLRLLAPELRARGYQLVCVTRYPQTSGDVGRLGPQVAMLYRLMLDERRRRS